MLIASVIIIVSLFSITSVSVVYPLQSINGQTFESNSTQANTTTTGSQIQWANYTNDKFGFGVEYPQSWIIEERQNRFENTVETAIIAPGTKSDTNWGRFNFENASPSTTSNIRVLTNLLMDAAIGGFDVDYDGRLIEAANTTRYQLGGERSGAFTYVLDKKDFTGGETTTTPDSAIEEVATIHDGKEYIFSFVASPENFDNPTLTQIRQHMFDSIRWVNSSSQEQVLN
jgi:hypothetical protein